LLVK